MTCHHPVDATATVRHDRCRPRAVREPLRTLLLAGIAVLLTSASAPRTRSRPAGAPSASPPRPRVRAAADAAAAAAATAPNIFFYNLDDLRDAFPGGDRPAAVHAEDAGLDGDRAPVHADVRRRPLLLPVPVVADDRPVPAQQRRAGPAGRARSFDGPHSMACYLRTAGYATYLDGKFLTTWPKTTLPPVLRPLDGDVGRLQQRRRCGSTGRSRTGTGYSTTYLGNQGRSVHHQRAVGHEAVPALRDPAGAALGRHHQPERQHLEAGRPRHQVRRRRTSGPAPGSPRPTAPTSRRTCAP